ncbi:MAG: beta-galactosidase trimerization domain-containing protein [Candidatus Latescibacteria bacterium]|nr:beta-galactosidase trimerization domain-containing protein [Candidatus Latescibacterota bacterium]
MKQPWHEQRFRANLIDMHIPDWNPAFLAQYDTKNYVDMLEQARVEVVYLYASSCLGICYWPTKVGHQHRGTLGRDLLGERIAECRRRGLEVVVYYNWWSKWAYDQHPDWRVVTAKGQNTADYLWTPGHYGVCCFNSPHRELVLSQIEELCTGYDFAGLWVDMIFWPYTVCYCGHCRRRYREEAGRDLPRIVNWEDPEWVAFQRRREQWMAEVVGAITDTVRRLKPGASVGHQCAGWSVGWTSGFTSEFFRHSDYLAGDFYGGAVEQSLVCKLFAQLSEKPLFEFMTSRSPDLTDHTTTKTREQLGAQAAAALAHRGRILLIDAIDPVGTLDPHVFGEMGAVFAELAPYEACLQPAARPLADVGIYFNFESLIDPRENGQPVPEMGGRPPVITAITNITRTLMQGHVAHTLLTPKNLDQLSQYQTIVLPELFMLDEGEVAAFEQYVAQGGNLYVARSTSLLNKDGVRQVDFMLGEVLGVSWVGQTAEEVTYMAPASGREDLFAPHTPSHPLLIAGSQLKVRVREGAQVLATITLPYTNPKDPTRFSSAISNPNGIATADPAVVLNQYGKGRALYMAGGLERMEHDSHRAFFRRLLVLLNPAPPLVRTDAPRAVEVLVFDQPAAARLLVTVLNHQAELPPIPVSGARLALRLDGRRPKRLVRFPEGTEIPFTEQEGYAEFELPRLDTLLMIGLEYAG